MADNILVAEGGTRPVATDQIGGVDHQRVKVQFGADGSATDVSDANPLPSEDTAAAAAIAAVEAAVEAVTAALGRTLTTSLPSGAATAANQSTIVGHVDGIEALLSAISGAVDGVEALLTTIDADTGALGATGDAAATAGSTGTLSAKLRFLTTQLDNLQRGGNVAHDAADSGNPVKIGGRARTALPAAVAQDDRVDATRDKFGRALALVAPLDQRRSGTANYTGTSAADVIAAPGASTALVVTRILVVNAHATVGTKVTVRDGTTAKAVGYAAALGGGWTIEDPNGLFVATANTAVTAICGTTGADVDVTVFGYTIPA